MVGQARLSLDGRAVREINSAARRVTSAVPSGGGIILGAQAGSLPEMAALFSDEARIEKWLEVELLAVEARAALGDVFWLMALLPSSV